MTTPQDAAPDILENTPVWICDPRHPHYTERGYLTGKVMTTPGGKHEMAEVRLVGCIHATEACFVSKGQIALDRRDK